MSLFAGQPDPARLRALLSADRVRMALCLHLDFANNPLWLCSRTIPFTDNEGVKWNAGGGLLVGLPEISVADDDVAALREYILGIPEHLAQAENWRALVKDEVRDVANYQGRDYSLRLQVFDDDGPAGFPIYLDRGEMSNMELSIAPDLTGLKLTCEAGALRFNVPPGLLLTDADQQALFPGDRGLEFVTDNTRQIVWTRF